MYMLTMLHHRTESRPLVPVSFISFIYDILLVVENSTGNCFIRTETINVLSFIFSGNITICAPHFVINGHEY